MMEESQARTCAACDLQLYGKGKSCESCGITYCAGCYSLKTKLDLSVGKTGVTSSPCQSCQNLIKLKKQSLPSSSDGDSSSQASSKSDAYPSDHKRKSSFNKNNEAKGSNLVTATSKASHQVESHIFQHSSSKGSLHSGTNATYAAGDDDWYDVEEEQFAENDQDDFYADIPYALVLCGLVKPGDKQKNLYKRMFSAMEKAKGLEMTIECLKAENARLKKACKNQSKHLLSDSIIGQNREESEVKPMSTAPANITVRNLETAETRENHKGTITGLPDQAFSKEIAWNDVNGSPATEINETFTTKMDPSKRNAVKDTESLEVNFQSHSRNEADELNDDNDGLTYSQRKGMKKPMLFHSFENSASSGTTGTVRSEMKNHKPLNKSMDNRDDKRVPVSGEFSFQLRVSNHSGGSFKPEVALTMTTGMKNKQSNVNSRTTYQDSERIMGDPYKDIYENAWKGHWRSGNVLENANLDAESTDEKANGNLHAEDTSAKEKANVDIEGESKNENPNLKAERASAKESANPYAERASKKEITNSYGKSASVKESANLNAESVSVKGNTNVDVESVPERARSKPLKKVDNGTHESSNDMRKTKSLDSEDDGVKSEHNVSDRHLEHNVTDRPVDDSSKKQKKEGKKTDAFCNPDAESVSERAIPQTSETFHNKTQESKSDKRKIKSPSSKGDRVELKQNASSISLGNSIADRRLAKSKTKQMKEAKKLNAFCNLDAMEKDDFIDGEQDKPHGKPYALSMIDTFSDQTYDKGSLALMVTFSDMSPTGSTSGSRRETSRHSEQPPTLVILNTGPWGKVKKNKKFSKVTEIPFVEDTDEWPGNTHGKQEQGKAATSFQSAFKYSSSSPKTSPKKNESSTSEKLKSGTNTPTESKVTSSGTMSSSVASRSVNLSGKNTPNIPPVRENLTKGGKSKASGETARPTPKRPAPVLKLKKPTATSSIEEKYHKGFVRLKQRQTEGRQKCSSCGRPECQGENMQSMSRMIKSARENGFQLQDVTPDGNCMFAAVVDQLAMYGDERFTTKTLRKKAVKWLEDHPYTECGTPRSEFLSEDWYYYIDRMGKDGEWGDHMILGAIAEVIGCTVRVMSPTDTEVHWTTIEPQGEGALTNDKHLILGHVGEFHYTSLRPTERQMEASAKTKPATAVWQDTESVEDPFDTEEDRLVSVFMDDHIDKPSDMPVAHFSHLLKTIIPIALIDEATIYMSEHGGADSEEFVQSGGSYSCQAKWFGPVEEGVHVRALDETVCPDSGEITITQFCVSIRKDVQIVPKSSPPGDYDEYVLDEESVSPGYTRLFSKSKNVLLLTPEIPAGGLSDSGKSQFTDRKRLVILYVVRTEMGIECHDWPETATPWKTRQRHEGWPDKDFIQSVVTEGCCVIPSTRENSRVEWQFCFGLIEKRIFREIVNQHQKHAYIMFKTLCRQALLEFEKVSQVLKSIFFYACEQVPSDLWESNIGACVLHMLEELLNGVHDKKIANYFIPSQNMLEELMEADFEKLEEEVQLLRSQPLLFLRQIQELAMVQYKGDEMIDLVASDFPNFQQHRSLKRSIMDAFVPSTILVAKENIKAKQYRKGYEILSKAYEERLAVSTCEDSLSYQMFLTGALSGLDLKSMTWFSAYADKNLQGQLSRSLIRELCNDLPLGKINQLLPADVAGEYHDIEIPLEFFQNIGRFCIDFGKFLYMIEKIPAALPVLYHCYERYQNERKARENVGQENGEGKGEVVSDVEDGVMLEVFIGMCRIYHQQGQLEFFRSLIPEIKLLCERIDTTEAYFTFLYFNSLLHDLEPMTSIFLNHKDKISPDQASNANNFFVKLSNWPYNKMH